MRDSHDQDSRSSQRILIIDDDNDVVLGVSLRLRAAGYETLAACDGEQGIAAAIDHHPDAIVLDVRMPRLDGLAALDRLRHTEATKAIPVVMVSASLVDKRAALDSGARFFLSKPYQPKSLLAALASAIGEV
jgi:CheY-like chemotaxis protein